MFGGTEDCCVLVQDWNNVNVEAGEFLVSGRKLLCVASDVGQSLHLFSYELQHPDTWRGKKLLPMCAFNSPDKSSFCIAVIAARVFQYIDHKAPTSCCTFSLAHHYLDQYLQADRSYAIIWKSKVGRKLRGWCISACRGAIHTGHNASCMLAHKIIPASSRGAANAAKAAALRLTAAVFGTTGGALGTFAPMWEDLPAQQLLVLQEELALAMQHTAGLNPSTFRCGSSISASVSVCNML